MTFVLSAESREFEASSSTGSFTLKAGHGSVGSFYARTVYAVSGKKALPKSGYIVEEIFRVLSYHQNK